jgi:hypothetical protein
MHWRSSLFQGIVMPRQRKVTIFLPSNLDALLHAEVGKVINSTHMSCLLTIEVGN